MEAKSDVDAPEPDYPSYAEYQNRRPAILKKVAWGVGLVIVLGGAVGACRQTPPTEQSGTKNNICVPNGDVKLRGDVATPAEPPKFRGEMMAPTEPKSEK
ncbi:MAG: hypothetical protein HQK55_16785 [Deltaproteobacteria bacterium]|nr:hypothetical protein [Deltaproteobacteria bacterium]